MQRLCLKSHSFWLPKQVLLIVSIVSVQGMATIDNWRTALTVGSAALLLAALFTTAQYRSAISGSALLELSAGGVMLAAREGLRRFNEGFMTRTSNKPVYNFRKKASEESKGKTG